MTVDAAAGSARLGLCHYHRSLMRTLAVYLTLLALLLVSLATGFLAADWPTWCGRVHLCAPGWPAMRAYPAAQHPP